MTGRYNTFRSVYHLNAAKYADTYTIKFRRGREVKTEPIYLHGFSYEEAIRSAADIIRTGNTIMMILNPHGHKRVKVEDVVQASMLPAQPGDFSYVEPPPPVMGALGMRAAKKAMVQEAVKRFKARTDDSSTDP